jgi:hypothetical protein
MWRTCLDWVKETAAEEKWTQTLQEKVTATVMSIPWHMGYHWKGGNLLWVRGKASEGGGGGNLIAQGKRENMENLSMKDD